MRLVTKTGCLAKAFGDEKTIRLLAKNGFEGIDWSFSEMINEENQWNQDDFRDHAKKLRDLAEECGIQIVQAHAPYPTSKGEAEYDDLMFQKILRSMEASSIMGVEQIVVHPRTHLNYLWNRQHLFDINLELYRRLIPYCEQWNIRVCAENMWTRDLKRDVIIDHCYARPEEFCELLDTIDSPWIVGCLDIGHAALVSVDPVYAIKTLGAKRIQALHVHDVDYLNDSHTLPFTQKLDWYAITKALGEIGYEGDFTFEADGFINGFPIELYADASLLMAKTGRFLINEVEKHRLINRENS